MNTALKMIGSLYCWLRGSHLGEYYPYDDVYKCDYCNYKTWGGK